MVVSSGFLDHAAEVYLRVSDSIMSNQPMNSSNRVNEWSQQLQQQQNPTNQLNASGTAIKLNAVQQYPARAQLTCQPNSHPFQTRNITLEPRIEVKVGRSVPRSRVEDSNAIFDCKVLSRNHAVIWYNDGTFFIKDTGSSNGTFINSARIKASEAYEISSGDIVQFGVDVTENSRKETHGCIIAQLKLVTPDGFEKTSYQSSQSAHDSDIYRLNQIMYESFQREKLLESKLISIQKAVATTRDKSSNSWQAMINEDLLLSRIDILENKLLCYQKNVTEEKLQNDVVKLQDDKTNYQITAKEALKKVYQERMSLQQKFTKSEQTTQNCEEELAVLRTQLESSKQKHEDLTQKLSAMEVERDELSVQCRQRTDKIDDLCQQLAKQNDEMNQARERLKELMTDNDELQNRMRIIENTNFIADDDSSDSNKNLTSSGNKAAFLDLINNSKLKGSDDIINAIWNDDKNGTETKFDLEKYSSKLSDKLLDIEKKYFDNETNSDNIIKETDESESALNDGNQNNRECINEKHDLEENRNFVVQLKELFAEYQHQMATVQTELKRAHKYDDMQRELSLKIKSLERELSQRPTTSDYEEQLRINQDLRNQILAKQSKLITHSGVETINDEICVDKEKPSVATTDSADSAIQRLSTNSISDDDTDIESIASNVTSDQSWTTQILATNDTDDGRSISETAITDDNLNTDDVNEDDVLDSFNRIIEEESKLVNNTNILHVEELVEFKERCIRLTDENVVLRKEINALRVSGNKNFNIFVYAAPVALLLVYYLLSKIFS